VHERDDRDARDHSQPDERRCGSGADEHPGGQRHPQRSFDDLGHGHAPLDADPQPYGEDDDREEHEHAEQVRVADDALDAVADEERVEDVAAHPVPVRIRGPLVLRREEIGHDRVPHDQRHPCLEHERSADDPPQRHLEAAHDV
jgi:hypothetical protein